MIFLFVTNIAVKAVLAAFWNDDFPESLAVKLDLLPLIFPVHMISGALALVLLPLAYILRSRPRWHRIAGRIAAVDILVSGATAYPVALMAPVTGWSAAGFSAQATIWLILLTLGIYNIRKRRIARHRNYMLMMAATTSGALFFRLFLGLWAKFGDIRQLDLFYMFDAWIAWILPLTLMGVILKRAKRGTVSELG